MEWPSVRARRKMQDRTGRGEADPGRPSKTQATTQDNPDNTLHALTLPGPRVPWRRHR
jgi:hypothetical protein